MSLFFCCRTLPGHLISFVAFPISAELWEGGEWEKGIKPGRGKVPAQTGGTTVEK